MDERRSSSRRDAIAWPALGRESVARVLGRAFRLPAWAWPLLALPVVVGVGIWTYRAIAAGIHARLESYLRTMITADVSAFDEWLSAEATLAELAASDPRVRDDVLELIAISRRTAAIPSSSRGRPPRRVCARPWPR
jgi:hypothetical protein